MKDLMIFFFAISFLGLSLPNYAQGAADLHGSEDKVIGKCQDAVDAHYDRVEKLNENVGVISGGQRPQDHIDVGRSEDKQNCKVRENRRSDGHLTVYTFNDIDRKDQVGPVKDRNDPVKDRNDPTYVGGQDRW